VEKIVDLRDRRSCLLGGNRFSVKLNQKAKKSASQVDHELDLSGRVPFIVLDSQMKEVYPLFVSRLKKIVTGRQADHQC
jgi:hypothetical protein